MQDALVDAVSLLKVRWLDRVRSLSLQKSFIAVVKSEVEKKKEEKEKRRRKKKRRKAERKKRKKKRKVVKSEEVDGFYKNVGKKERGNEKEKKK